MEDKDIYPKCDEPVESDIKTELSQLTLDQMLDTLTLDKLPLELLIHICEFLDAGFIVHTFSKVCQLFKDLISGDAYWRTRIRKKWPKPYPPVSGKIT